MSGIAGYSKGPVGASVHNLTAEAVANAGRIGALLLQAQKAAETVSPGFHQRRKRGPGDSFWQYRTYQQGDGANLIDWRKSARSTSLLVREQEWEAAHTIWINVDQTKSMQFSSDKAIPSKQDRALVIALALSSVLLGQGERIGIPKTTRPAIGGHSQLENLALNWTSKKPEFAFDSGDYRSLNHVVFISDFLTDIADLEQNISRLASNRCAVYLVQISDPAECNFPYRGHITFQDPESGQRFRTPGAQDLGEGYRAKFAAHCDHIKLIASRNEFTSVHHQTDNQASDCLLALKAAIGQSAPRSISNGMFGTNL